MSTIRAAGIQVAYDQKTIIDGLDCQLEEGKITTIIGSNGCGKSTLLKAFTRILPTRAGSILLDGQAIAELPTKAVARKIALLPQVLEAAEGIRVYDLVSYGRYPHQSYLGALSAEDRDKIDWALEATKSAAFAHEEVDALSGGQRQRVWIAMALAQDTDTIFLDEPTTYLDMNHQLEVLELLQELNQANGKTIVMVLHDLNLAARFSDQLIAMKAGQIRRQGRVEDLMTPEMLREIFDIEAQIIQDPIQKRPLCLSYQLIK
ncbi:ABC transporter ATP-binding protein [Streptococcus panodentis]|uniref:Iron ABC transporter ATP-binding protein n=1 Tax=Streptococcus panodentis TaxID=1581472 RepID=A0ABS5AWG7_9STRE|nr:MULTISPECIES: ABC transporter ATP-binding protein [Streptococcus]KXT84609.1 Ferrichrome transport ATP-binding protein FhuC [Streptococcus sp. DD11]MBP2620922.1 iron ABC transporter ATP-binding protein [Streptococcus panodentis]